MSDEKKQFAEETCCVCGIIYGMPPHLQQMRRKDYMSLWCPNGHSQKYTEPKVDPKDAELTKLRSELKEATDKATRLQKEVEELKLDLEIWKPATSPDYSVVESKGS